LYNKKDPKDEEVYRIDFKYRPTMECWTVIKLAKDAETGELLTVRITYGNDFKLQDVLNYLEQRGWSVRNFMFEWNGEPYLPGARAFKGQPWPIRKREEMQRMRSEIKNHISERIASGQIAFKGAPYGGFTGGFNLAFDL
jgi:hypothetical protein